MVCWALTVLVVSTFFKIIFSVVTVTHLAFCLLHIFTCQFLKNRSNNVLIAQIVKTLFLQKFHQIVTCISVTVVIKLHSWAFCYPVWETLLSAPGPNDLVSKTLFSSLFLWWNQIFSCSIRKIIIKNTSGLPSNPQESHLVKRGEEKKQLERKRKRERNDA